MIDKRALDSRVTSEGGDFPRYRCKACGCLWRLIPANQWIGETWSLVPGQTAGACCDNVVMDLEKCNADDLLEP